MPGSDHEYDFPRRELINDYQGVEPSPSPSVEWVAIDMSERRRRRQRHREVRSDSEVILRTESASPSDQPTVEPSVEPVVVGQILDDETEVLIEDLGQQILEEEATDSLDVANSLAREIGQEVQGGSQHSEALQLLYTRICLCIDSLNTVDRNIFFEAHPELSRFDPRAENSNSALTQSRSRSRSPMVLRWPNLNLAAADTGRPPVPRQSFRWSRVDAAASGIPSQLLDARATIDTFEDWFAQFLHLPGTPASLGRQFRIFRESLLTSVEDQLEEARLTAQDQALEQERETLSRQNSLLNLDDAEKCPLCCDLPPDMTMDCCGQKLCEICLQRHQLRDPRCPYCRASGNGDEPRESQESEPRASQESNRSSTVSLSTGVRRLAEHDEEAPRSSLDVLELTEDFAEWH